MTVIKDTNSLPYFEYYKENFPFLPQRAINGLPDNQNFLFSEQSSPFHTVRIWEFTNLHAIIVKDVWITIAAYIKRIKPKKLEKKLQIKERVLEEIQRKPDYATHISNWYQLGLSVGLTPEEIERSVKAVRFRRNGSLEYITFPFEIDVYAWRMLCHTVGDGSVKYHKTTRALPEIKWAQDEKNQSHMLQLIRRWNPQVENSDMSIKFPKVLTF